MLERDFYCPLRLGAAREGIVLWRIPDGGASTPCDLMGVLPDGRAVLVEVKRQGDYRIIDRHRTPGLLSTHQRTSLRAAARRGGVGLLVTVVGLGSSLEVWVDKVLVGTDLDGFEQRPNLSIVREGKNLFITGWLKI